MHRLEFRQLAKLQWTFTNIPLDFAIGECPIGENLIGEVPVTRIYKNPNTNEFTL
jgi:hypothetical protein